MIEGLEDVVVFLYSGECVRWNGLEWVDTNPNTRVRIDGIDRDVQRLFALKRPAAPIVRDDKILIYDGDGTEARNLLFAFSAPSPPLCERVKRLETEMAALTTAVKKWTDML